MNSNHIFILTLGVFSILNTEMGVIGILPLISQTYKVDISTAGLLVSLFALAIATTGTVFPMLFSRFERKKVMIFVLGVFLLCNIISAFANNFTVVLVSRVIPAFFHPVYVSLAFSVAAASVRAEDIPKAISKVMIGVSAGMVLGVPIVSYIADITSLQVAMLSFAAVNAVALVATLIFIPTMPIGQRLSYATQLGVLKKASIWIALIAVILLNGAIFGVYSYMAEYLNRVTGLAAGSISIMLLGYGLTNIIGNIIAGKLLSSQADRFIAVFPVIVVGLYITMLFSGQYSIVMAVIMLLWGILAGACANINQYLISTVASNVPDFANGLFLVAANLGTSIGAVVCGYFITWWGIQYVVIGGIAFILLSVFMLLLRVLESKERGTLQTE